MPGYARTRLAALLLAVLVTIVMSRGPAMAAGAADIDGDANEALALLYQISPAAVQADFMALAVKGDKAAAPGVTIPAN